MIVLLHIRRSSGSTEIHRLPAQGDTIEVPGGLLSADDVLGFDIEIPSLDHGELELGVAASVHREPGGVRAVVD